jgi:hypothetical protein
MIMYVSLVSHSPFIKFSQEHIRYRKLIRKTNFIKTAQNAVLQDVTSHNRCQHFNRTCCLYCIWLKMLRCLPHCDIMQSGKKPNCMMSQRGKHLNMHHHRHLKSHTYSIFLYNTLHQMINFVNKWFEIIYFNLKNSIKGTPKIYIYTHTHTHLFRGLG